MKRTVLLLICVCLVAVSFAGCGKKKAIEAVMPDEISGEGPSYTWDTSPVEITAYVGLEGYGYKWDTNIVTMKHLTDTTGVSLKIQSGNNERLNAMVATGNLPDIIVLNDINNPIRHQLEENNMVWDFDTLIEKYAPDMKISASMHKWYEYKDGLLYGYPSYFGAVEDMEKYPDVVKYEYHNKFIVRKDLCDFLGIGLDEFSTKDGFISALKKVKEARITANGSVVAPTYFYTQPHPLRIAQLFGMPLEDKNGDWVEVRKHEKYKEAILFINRMYREGLIPEDAWTATADTVDSKLNNGSVFSLFDKSSCGNLAELNRVKPDASFVAVNPPKSNDGADPAITAVSTAGWTWLAIPKTTKIPDRIIRFLNYMTTDEGQLLNYYGVEGITYEFDSNGRVKYTKDTEDLIINNRSRAANKYGFDFFCWMFNWSTYQRFNPILDTPNAVADRQINDFYRDYVYDARCAELVEPESGSDLLALQTKINTYWNQEEAKMMRASSEKEAEKLYNAAIKKIDDMGLEKINKYKNEKFHDNKDLFDIDYIYKGNAK